jgi:hypothetical protein
VLGRGNFSRYVDKQSGLKLPLSVWVKSGQTVPVKIRLCPLWSIADKLCGAFDLRIDSAAQHLKSMGLVKSASAPPSMPCAWYPHRHRR